MQREPASPAPNRALGPLSAPVLISAAAEALAGAFLAGVSFLSPLPYLLAAASALLFGAGCAFGDHFDRAARNARPQTDSPDDGASSWRLGWALLLLGGLLPVLGGRNSAATAVGVALLVILYYAVTRSVWGVGYATMGAARALNLLLGMTAHEFGLRNFAGAGLGIFLYTVGWEVFRTTGRRDAPPTTPFVALLHLGAGVAALLHFASSNQFYWIDALVFLVPALALSFPWFVNTVMDPRPGNVAAGVQWGFLSLTLLEAALAAGLSGIHSGILLAALAAALYLTLRREPISLGKG
jgi:4-hydroxybenzoate polyprenyltransferase